MQGPQTLTSFNATARSPPAASQSQNAPSQVPSTISPADYGPSPWPVRPLASSPRTRAARRSNYLPANPCCQHCASSPRRRRWICCPRDAPSLRRRSCARRWCCRRDGRGRRGAWWSGCCCMRACGRRRLRRRCFCYGWCQGVRNTGCRRFVRWDWSSCCMILLPLGTGDGGIRSQGNSVVGWG